MTMALPQTFPPTMIQHSTRKSPDFRYLGIKEERLHVTLNIRLLFEVLIFTTSAYGMLKSQKSEQ